MSHRTITFFEASLRFIVADNEVLKARRALSAAGHCVNHGSIESRCITAFAAVEWCKNCKVRNALYLAKSSALRKRNSELAGMRRVWRKDYVVANG